jgi:hypothetical protein
MLLQVFSVYDSKAEAYLPPFYIPAIGAAIRHFSDSANDPQTAFHKHPEDYGLFHLGSFDDNLCSFDLLPTPLHLGLAQDLL